VAAASVVVAGVIVFVWRIGPVVLVLSRTHGVHRGDALAAVPLAVAVLAVRGRRAGYTSRPRATRTATSTTLTAVTASPHHGRPVAASASPASTNSAI